MRTLKILLFIPAVLLAQTVVIPRLNFFGVMPDLVLISAIVFAVLEERAPATLFSAGMAFLQDVLSTGIYINTILKVVASNVVCEVKERFVGSEYRLAIGMTALFSAGILVLEYAFFYFVLRREGSLFVCIFKLFAVTAYNVLMMLLIFPILKGLLDGTKTK